MEAINIKQTFSITLPVPLYEQLLQEVGKGKISQFIKKAVEKELKKTDKQSLKTAYQALENCSEYQSEAEEGEIYWVELDPVKGSEIKKTRPCLIISNDEQNEVSRRVMVIPLTSSRKLPPAPFHVSLLFQNKLAKILPEQMRVADKSRIKGRCLGRVGWEVLSEDEKLSCQVLDKRDGTIFLLCRICREEGKKLSKGKITQGEFKKLVKERQREALLEKGKMIIEAKMQGKEAEIIEDGEKKWSYQYLTENGFNHYLARKRGIEEMHKKFNTGKFELIADYCYPCLEKVIYSAFARMVKEELVFMENYEEFKEIVDEEKTNLETKENQLPRTPPNLQIPLNHSSFTPFYLLSPTTNCLGVLAGGLLLALFRNKGQLILDNTPEFLDYCTRSNGLVFFGSIGSGKTAILAMLAQELPGENKYATFPCNLPWAEKAQIDFSNCPSQRLGVTETIFLDEINLLFKGNIVQDVREKQRFLMHFIALSRHQGTRLFVNAQRLGQVAIEQREVTTAICQVSLLQKTDEGKKYLDTYNSYWLKKWLNKNYPLEKRKGITKLLLQNHRLKGSLSLKGFNNLTFLNCRHNRITSLDLSDCQNLRKLYCEIGLV
ncbi:20085_t:CDS:2 [Gigaspora margarita]|uniref:20085_t:CDS:1 n=1 Tax=Gigaspora margarita TaxID=4874 RepID=A0ABN7UNV4_GIGMA|nr:20085_t:CDS:2 [Gigaspora margarita]